MKRKTLHYIFLVICLLLLLFFLSVNVASYKEEEPLQITQSSSMVRATSRPPDDLEFKIISCESNWNPEVCNREYGCRGGMGLWQFISGTWNTTLIRMEEAGVYLPDRCWKFVTLPVSTERTEAVFDHECNLLAGRWLLRTDGDRHWRTWSGPCYLK